MYACMYVAIALHKFNGLRMICIHTASTSIVSYYLILHMECVCGYIRNSAAGTKTCNSCVKEQIVTKMMYTGYS